MDQRSRPKSDERIDPDDLETALRVIGQLDRLPAEHPDSVTIQQAAAGLYKSVKKRRKLEKRRQVLEHDAEITARTATAAPGRIDDETEGLPLVSSAKGAIAGTLIEARACYICKQPFHQVDAFYHQLCPDCAAFNHARRDARTDLTGKRALLTGGRAKIGMYIALRLLRDGADTTITTRFPNDAVRRFRAMKDSESGLTVSTSSGSTCATRGRWSTSPTRSRPGGPLDIPDQQRLPDGPPHTGCLRPADPGRSRGSSNRPGPGHRDFRPPRRTSPSTGPPRGRQFPVGRNRRGTGTDPPRMRPRTGLRHRMRLRRWH